MTGSRLLGELQSSLRPTPEQQQIVEAMPRPESQMIQAYAGTAKTTTLVMAAQQVRHPALALAFNKKIAQELQAKLPRSFTCKTLNSLGYGAWQQAHPRLRCRMEPDTRGKIISEVCREMDLRGSDCWGKVRDLLQGVQGLGATPPGFAGAEPLQELTRQVWLQLARDCWIDQEDLVPLGEAALEVLRRSIVSAQAGTLCSFDDQIYLPLCFGGKWPQFGLVLGDEVQDWNLLNHEMVRRCLKPGGKLVLAGDSRQSLYAFRGALSDSMERARGIVPQWLDQQLTLTFRCPRAVVERQQDHAPGYAAAPGNREGKVLEWNFVTNEKQALPANVPPANEPWEWTWVQFEAIWRPAALPAAVLCRNNAPLLRLCLQLLRRGIRTSFLGKDLGKGLLALAKKICGKAQGKEVLQARVAQWREKELAGLDPGAASDSIEDRAECLLAILETPGVNSGEVLQATLQRLLAQDGAVQLSSIHRAKGLEWDVVMLLDPWRIPRKGAKGEELKQELNARYVAETRTRDVLVLANLADLSWEEEKKDENLG